ncbi:MAG TPA: N-acetylmuramoyl-L-alanine amidase [Candidatus Cybelea sp.]|nr:N-acetylmuramoyl-L-alanine amidase [Candidatus Cybelea sp.]
MGAALLSALWITVAAARPVASNVRIGDNGGATRFVLDVSEPVAFEIFVLADPYRVVVDLPDMQWQLPSVASTQSRGLVLGYRFGQFRPGTARMVLDVAGPVEVAKAFLLPAANGQPSRFVLDLKTTDRQSFLDAVRRNRPQVPQPAAFAPVAPPPKPAQAHGRKIIVIDAGHGGVDPGTIATDGAFEKTLTLALAKEVQHKLAANGRYRVLMTRSDDSFVELRDRVQYAREAGADLFISLHADAVRDHGVRGGTVYTLSQTASDKEAEALASEENRSDLIAGVDLSGESDQVTSILIDLAQRETLNHSAAFAQMLVDELGRRVVMHTNGHRFAGFRVLKAPDVPSVLIEAGYLSNHQDESMLRSPAGKAKLADAIQRAVDRYFAAEKS